MSLILTGGVNDYSKIDIATRPKVGSRSAALMLAKVESCDRC